MNYDYGISIIF